MFKRLLKVLKESEMFKRLLKVIIFIIAIPVLVIIVCLPIIIGIPLYVLSGRNALMLCADWIEHIIFFINRIV